MGKIPICDIISEIDTLCPARTLIGNKPSQANGEGGSGIDVAVYPEASGSANQMARM